MEFEIVDRYTALGIPHPSPETMCLGQCEGTGIIPVLKDDEDDVLRGLWNEAENKEPSHDGYHFVVCPECKGTGLRTEQE